MNINQARFDGLHRDLADLIRSTKLLIIPRSTTGQVLLFTQVWEDELLVEAIRTYRKHKFKVKMMPWGENHANIAMVNVF